ncbi:MAG TPA: GLPGLI family protein [Chitinophagaceae bacterium]|nr:GLPGLI family protein [Chitinophagaceae bacterium]
MKKLLPLLLFILPFKSSKAQRQITIGDCTVTYSITGSDASINSNLAGATKTLYIKGKMARIEITGTNYKQSVIYDNEKGTAVILKEVGAEKYMSTFNAAEWKKENRQFEGLAVTLTNETKTILGYECKKAIAHLKDGSSYNIYYATAIIPSASENPYQFKDIPGFILQYETFGNKNSSRITYTATLINFNPVPASRFEVPSSGYRVLK